MIINGCIIRNSCISASLFFLTYETVKNNVGPLFPAEYQAATQMLAASAGETVSAFLAAWDAAF